MTELCDLPEGPDRRALWRYVDVERDRTRGSGEERRAPAAAPRAWGWADPSSSRGGPGPVWLRLVDPVGPSAAERPSTPDPAQEAECRPHHLSWPAEHCR
ncbi:hypothetical protein GCM10010430_12930 [Kitasatospora cystarginea]|uniref:Uncharacterized protein n=1 Tax=Kitasatospora cystarginea TaxID=58350 RepID=A0ABN3DJV8_9ACTN